MCSNIFGSYPEQNYQTVHRIALPVEDSRDSKRFLAIDYRLSRDLSHSVPVGGGNQKATGETTGRTARPDEAGSRATLRNEARKGASGDEGKGNATSVKPHLEGVRQGHICERGTNRNAGQKEHR